MKIDEFKIEDADKVIDLWSRCGLLSPNNDPRKDIERKMKVDPDLFLVLRSQEKIIGSVMGGYEGHRGWINYLAVDPKSRRCGVATKLMKEVEQRLIKKGCPKINLQVRESNLEVLAFYDKLGFSVDKVVSLGKRLVLDEPSNKEYNPGEKRVKFDFEIEFTNGGGIQGQDFRLDIENDDITDEELAAYIVKDMRLLMVGKVLILNKEIISEAHKRTNTIMI